MYPELFPIGNFMVHTYGFMIMLGAIAGYLYLSNVLNKELNIKPEKVQNLALWIILMAFVGGKLLFYLEKPSFYFDPPSNMMKNFRQGFVFYGSLLFAVPTAIWFFRKEKWPVWPILDHLAFTALIVHMFGRMGCFFAGCCYGIPTDSILGITFHHHESQAPLGMPIHPTQLYEVTMLISIFFLLYKIRPKKTFHGQIFLIYLMVYAAGRGVIEIFRGDIRRGFIIENVLSHSQLISLVLILIVFWAYRTMSKSPGLKVKSAK
jgi:phosphatidylglycerol:prolipoprotein diacylglycerol transferase